MSYYNEIEVHEVTQNYQSWTDKTKFAPDKTRGWWWLQKFCFYVLTKLECYASIVSATYQTKKIVLSDDILNEVRKQITQIRRYGQEEDFIIMGNPEYANMMSDFHKDPYSFTIRTDPYHPVHRSLFGLEVHVIPWIRGIVVVPKSRN